MVKLDRDSCRKTECVTIPYSNYSQNIEDGWLVSSSTGVPTKNAIVDTVIRMMLSDGFFRNAAGPLVVLRIIYVCVLLHVLIYSLRDNWSDSGSPTCVSSTMELLSCGHSDYSLH